MMRLTMGSLCLFLWLSLGQVNAQVNDPLQGKNQYPQFRNLSALAGGLYGVDELGYGSLFGPVAYSTPNAYVLGHDQIRIAEGKTSFTNQFEFRSNHSNGTAFVTYGHTFGPFNITATDMFLSTIGPWDVFNLQMAYMPSRREHLVPSIGVQDVLGHGGSAGDGYHTNAYSSQSVFGVLTYRLDTKRAPVYFSAGMGTHRYNKSFESVSYRFAGPFRYWIEYDGWGFNQGLLYTYRTRIGRAHPELNATFCMIRGKYPTIGLSFGI